jgi:hypothetical protein
MSDDGSPVRRPAPVERQGQGMQTTLIDSPLACRMFDRQMVANASICGDGHGAEARDAPDGSASWTTRNKLGQCVALGHRDDIDTCATS